MHLCQRLLPMQPMSDSFMAGSSSAHRSPNATPFGFPPARIPVTSSILPDSLFCLPFVPLGQRTSSFRLVPSLQLPPGRSMPMASGSTPPHLHPTAASSGRTSVYPWPARIVQQQPNPNVRIGATLIE
jgi:hypothetical protein